MTKVHSGKCKLNEMSERVKGIIMQAYRSRRQS